MYHVTNSLDGRLVTERWKASCPRNFKFHYEILRFYGKVLEKLLWNEDKLLQTTPDFISSP